ncbi:flavodoxin family protein [Sphingomonas koreensis]|uniref:Flavodoxin family protein n=1 Tax=Sphingomonas koreensis TaxID=93064 RepID=A0A430FZ02_9SPHN|nr:NAD(P)H-dependent oxidoreductase [Sphingomonas koreensis]RSY77913.1 flavodoxin family protein [Sphingomonas koreensis]
MATQAKRRIAIIDGHPDPDRARFVHALADAYADGALIGRLEVRRIELAGMDFPLIRSRTEWTDGKPVPEIAEAQATIAWADHLVILYPLWLGDMPALLKGFLEQVARPGFAIAEGPRGPRGLLKGKSARLVVTMGMPAFFYRFYFGAHSVKSLERNILKLAGIRPVAQTLIGGVEGSAEQREEWLAEMLDLGSRGA